MLRQSQLTPIRLASVLLLAEANVPGLSQLAEASVSGLSLLARSVHMGECQGRDVT